jgi:hypothetical protein
VSHTSQRRASSPKLSNSSSIAVTQGLTAYCQSSALLTSYLALGYLIVATAAIEAGAVIKFKGLAKAGKVIIVYVAPGFLAELVIEG